MADNEVYRGPPMRGKRRFVDPLPGHRECYECGGDGACVLCGGRRATDAGKCDYCCGWGRCIVCRGAGQISEG